MAPRKTNSTGSSKQLMASLKTLALGFPGAWADNPWGDSVVKVGKKIFVFLGEGAEDAGITVKVPESHEHTMSFDGCHADRVRARKGGVGDDPHRWSAALTMRRSCTTSSRRATGPSHRSG